MYANTCRARLMSNQRDVLLVAVEVLNVLINELHCHALIMQAEIAGRTRTLRTQKAQWTQTIIDCHNDKATLGQNKTIVQLR